MLSVGLQFMYYAIIILYGVYIFCTGSSCSVKSISKLSLVCHGAV